SGPTPAIRFPRTRDSARTALETPRTVELSTAESATQTGRLQSLSVRRRLLTFSSCLSLLLCVATPGLWVRSYFVLDHVKHQWVLTRSELHSFRARGGGVRGVMSFDLQYIHAWVDTPRAVAGPEAFTRRCSSILADRDMINRGGAWISRPAPAPSSHST